MQGNNEPLCEFRWKVRTFTRPIAKVTGQTISLCVIAVSSVSQDFGVHNICTKRSSPGKTITEGWFQKLQVILCRKCGTEM